MSTLVSWDPTLGYSDWPSIPAKILKSPANKPGKARNNTEWQINIRERKNCSKLTSRFFRAEGWERLYWRKRLEVPPWELNGWLQYVDGEFMYFQTGGYWPWPLIPGVSWWPLVTSDDGMWVVTGGREEIIYPRFIVKLLTALERLELQQPPGMTRPGSNATLLSGRMILIIWNAPPEPEPCAPCPENHCVTWVTWGHLADKNSKWRASRCRVTEGRCLSNEQQWEGVHCPQSKLELGHEKFKMDPCNF